MQVDYGSGPMVRDVPTGKYRRTRLFVLTLGYSRKSVRLLVFGSSSQIWAELHEKAFRRLGGVTKVVVLDNLREGVLQPDIYDPTLNPVYRDMLQHYQVVALPCRVRDPDRKAYVSYCTSCRWCNGEYWLTGLSASVALMNRARVQRFIETAPVIVVRVLLQFALSCPKIDCSGCHAVPHAHFRRGEQPPCSQSAVATLQLERLPDMRDLLQTEGLVLPSAPTSPIQNLGDLAITVIVQQRVNLGDHLRFCLPNLSDRQWLRQSETSNGAAAEAYMDLDHFSVD